MPEGGHHYDVRRGSHERQAEEHGQEHRCLLLCGQQHLAHGREHLARDALGKRHQSLRVLWRETTRALSQQRLGNAYAEEYTLALETSLTSTEGLSAALSSLNIKTTSWTLGGQVQGKKIHNKYPESVAPDNKQDQGRGRMIPL